MRVNERERERHERMKKEKKKKKGRCIILINQPNNFFFFFALNYSAHLYTNVHCSKSSKILDFASTTAA